MFAHFLAGMIVWCAYCQRLIREVAPLTRYDISHGVCATCAHDMHLRPADVMLGLIQPALVEIGHKWEQGGVTAADEHEFTAWCEHGGACAADGCQAD